jgi:hypothetical protein
VVRCVGMVVGVLRTAMRMGMLMPVSVLMTMGESSMRVLVGMNVCMGM